MKIILENVINAFLLVSFWIMCAGFCNIHKFNPLLIIQSNMRFKASLIIEKFTLFYPQVTHITSL